MKNNSFWHEYRILFLIIGIGVGLRLITAIYFGNEVTNLPGTFDQISYHKLALRLANGHGFSFGEEWWPITPADAPTAHWSYLYTAFLAAIYRIFGPLPLVARLLQAIIVGIMQPTLVFLIGRHVFNKPVALVAAGLTTIYIYFVYYSATLMTEPFFIIGILASLYLTILLVKTRDVKKQWKLAFGLGVMLALTILLRQLFLFFVPILLLWLVWASYKDAGRLPIWPIGLVLILVVIIILPFTIYNYTRFQQLVLLNTNAGYAFFWANHPIYGTHFEAILPDNMGSYQELIPPELRQLNEAALDRELLKRGIQFVVDAPGRYILLSLSRIPIFFTFWPSAASSTISNISRVLSFGILWPFMLFGLVDTVKRHFELEFLSKPAFLLIIFSGFYTLIHLLSWSLIRYRLPVDAVLLIFASAAILKLASKLRMDRVLIKAGSVSERYSTGE